MRPMVLDVMHLPDDDFGRDAFCLGDGSLDVSDLRRVPESIPDSGQVRPSHKRVQSLVDKMRLRVSIHSHMVDAGQRDAAGCEAILDGLDRTTRPMLDACESLFFCGCDELAVAAYQQFR